MSADHILLERPCPGVAVVRLNRPERLNALDEAMNKEQLPGVLRRLAQDDELNVVIIVGTGRAFCAGADLSAIAGIDRSDAAATRAFVAESNSAVLSVFDLPQVTIAALNGVAAGAGVGLAAACDIRIGQQDSSLSLPFIKMGLALDFGLSATLPRLVGYPASLELSLTGRKVPAAEALSLGFLDHLCDDALDAAVQLGRQLAAAPPHALRAIKHNLQRGPGTDITAVVQGLETSAQAGALGGAEFAGLYEQYLNGIGTGRHGADHGNG